MKHIWKRSWKPHAHCLIVTRIHPQMSVRGAWAPSRSSLRTLKEGTVEGSLWQLHDKPSLSSIITSHIAWYSYLRSHSPHIHKDFPLPCLTAWFAVFLSDFPEAKTFLFWRGSIGGAFFYRHIPSAIDFSCAWKRVANKTMGQGISAKNDGKPPFFWYNSV